MESLGFQLEPVRAFFVQIGIFLPRLLVGIFIVIIGWLVAKAARFALVKALRAFNFNVLTERAGLDGFLRQGGVESDTTDIFGWLAYWLVILAALLIAFNGMGLTYISELLGRVVRFVPHVFVALLVLAFGSYFARFIGETVRTYCRSIKLPDAVLMGKLAQYPIMVFVILIALEQLQIGGDILRQSFLVILIGFVFALALAFGLGGREWAADRIEEWWPRRKRDSVVESDTRPPQVRR